MKIIGAHKPAPMTRRERCAFLAEHRRASRVIEVGGTAVLPQLPLARRGKRLGIHWQIDRLGFHWGVGPWWAKWSCLGRFEAYVLYVFRRRVLFRPIDYARYEGRQ